MCEEFRAEQRLISWVQAVELVRQIVLALGNRGVRLATLGYVGHLWELFAMYCHLVTLQVQASNHKAPAHGTQLQMSHDG